MVDLLRLFAEYGLTERVLAVVFEVSNTLGAGFLEKVYQRALMQELALRGIPATAEAPLRVTYKGRPVGEYFADILVEGVLAIELKMRGTPRQPAYGSMPQLSTRVRTWPLPAGQL